jgi:restriction system protein
VAVPDFQSLMQPILRLLEDGEQHSVSELRAMLADQLQLTAKDLEERLPSGRAKTFNNRVGWATTYLYRCGLVARPRRSVYARTDRGHAVLSQHPHRVDLQVLSQFSEFHEFRRARNDRIRESAQPSRANDSAAAIEDESTPEERMVAAHTELQSALAEELRDLILDQPPEFLEQLVLDVLRAMGYGGARADAAERLGQSGDEGIDGVIREDRLGLDQIYVQAKRWALGRTIGRPEIQRFVGALHGQRASKGVFITTSSFSSEATEYAAHVTPRVVLIDGRELAQMMIEHGVGVSVETQFEVKRVDSDYFGADEKV